MSRVEVVESSLIWKARLDGIHEPSGRREGLTG